MRTILIDLVVAAVLGLTTSNAQGASCQVQSTKHSGLYELRDVMEIASMIELNASGNFHYMLTYGAVDEVAEGCWTDNGTSLELKPTRMQVSPGGNKFRKLVLKVRKPGLLVRDFGGGHKGSYAQIRR